MSALSGVVLQTYAAPAAELRGQVSTGGVYVRVKGTTKTYVARCVGTFARGDEVTIVSCDPAIGPSTWIVDE